MGDARAVAAALLIAASACADSPTGPARSDPIDLALDWKTATPASQRIQADRLEAAVAHARSLPRLLSLLVVRHGKLVLEEYFNGNHADSLNDVRSVTKSVIGTLVGTAIQRGVLPAAGDPIGNYLRPPILELQPDKAAIRVRDLLTMSGGFLWDESTTLGYNEWILSGDYLGYLLDRPLVAAPGATFNYNSAAVHLLSVTLAVAAGGPLDAFADRELFAPLGIRRVRWEILPDNFPNGGSGIDLRPRDLAKLGALWLQGGRSGDRQILHAAFVQEGTQPAFPWWQTAAPLRGQSYGFLWWLTRDTQPAPGFYASGHGGQFVWVAPDLDAVIVVTTDWRNSNGLANQFSANGLDLIVNHVLPAFR